MAKIKNIDSNKAKENVEKLDHSCFAGGNVQWYSL